MINVEKTIQALTNKAESAKPDEALKLTQSALNLAHTRATLVASKKHEDDNG